MRTPPASTLVALCAPVFVLLASCRPAETAAVPMPEPSQPVVEYVTTQEILTPLPLRVWLPARYGAERVTIRNLRVVKIDIENNLLLVHGAVPGFNGAVVMVRPTNFKK